MNRTTTGVRSFSPFYSQHTAQRARGGQIDWSKVPDEFYLAEKFIVQLNGAIAVGADALVVDALTSALKQGQILRGADVPTVVVNVGAAGAIATATSVPVDALTGPIPNGTTIRLGTKKFITLTAAAALGATSLTVEALATALVQNDTGTYQGGENNIEVLADAAVGDTSVTVGNILFPMPDNYQLEATNSVTKSYRKIRQGTVMARLSSGLLIPRSAITGAETACGFLFSDADEGSRSDAKSGYGLVVGGTAVWENLLPDCDTTTGLISSTYKTELIANGVIVQYQVYLDSRVV